MERQKMQSILNESHCTEVIAACTLCATHKRTCCGRRCAGGAAKCAQEVGADLHCTMAPALPHKRRTQVGGYCTSKEHVTDPLLGSSHRNLNNRGGLAASGLAAPPRRPARPKLLMRELIRVFGMGEEMKWRGEGESTQPRHSESQLSGGLSSRGLSRAKRSSAAQAQHQGSQGGAMQHAKQQKAEVQSSLRQEICPAEAIPTESHTHHTNTAHSKAHTALTRVAPGELSRSAESWKLPRSHAWFCTPNHQFVRTRAGMSGRPAPPIGSLRLNTIKLRMSQPSTAALAYTDKPTASRRQAGSGASARAGGGLARFAR